MLLNFSEICKKYSVKTTGVIHVGSHWGQEYDEYLNNGIEQVVFIEPCEAAFKKLWERFHHNENVVLINRACSDYAGRATMFTGDNTVNQGQSNSLLKPDKHLVLHPTVEFNGEEEVLVDTVASLLSKINPPNFGGGGWMNNFKLLVMDTQGTEGRVLRGAMGVL